MIPTKFQFIWASGFRGEDFLEINQSEKRMTCGSHNLKKSSPLKPLGQMNRNLAGSL
jgi:hypothetical protein